LQDLSRQLPLEHPQGLGGLANNNNPDSLPSETPNFAQAALLVQNSSNIYSRKVEYLHRLVYKALDEFFKDNNSSNNNNNLNNRRKSADASIDEFQNFDPHTEFLLLDDMLPEDHANKINLAPDEDDEDGNIDLAQTPNRSQSVNKTRLSLGGLSVTNMERTLYRGSSPSQQRALLGTLNTGTLRLLDGRCDIGDDGVLLMPGSSQSPPLPTSVRGSLGRRLSLLTPLGKLPPGIEIHGASSNYDTNGLEPMQMDDYDDDHDNDGPGFDFGTDDNDHYEVPSAEDVQPVGLFRQAASTTENKRVTFAETLPVKKKVDPWLLMDPHERQKDSKNHKPLRKGKTYRLPPGIDQPPSQCVTGARTRRLPKPRQPLSRLDNDAPRVSLAASTFRRALQKHHGHHNKRIQETPLPLNGLVFSEFAYIAKETAKKRAAEQRAQRKQQAIDQPNQYHADDDDDDDDHGGGYDFGGGDDHDDDDEAGGNAGMTSLEDAFTNNDDHENQDLDSQQESNIGKTFEELCRAHIQAFAKGAEEYALNTQLTDRVSQWQAKLAPILEEEEKRAEFDIHKYSSRVIEIAQQEMQKSKSKRKSDGSIQVCTIFL
jgi:condensin-2 complex subunit H2